MVWNFNGIGIRTKIEWIYYLLLSELEVRIFDEFDASTVLFEYDIITNMVIKPLNTEGSNFELGIKVLNVMWKPNYFGEFLRADGINFCVFILFASVITVDKCNINSYRRRLNIALCLGIQKSCCSNE